MYDYMVWYNGTIIADIKADNDKHALTLAKQIYGDNVTIEKH